MRDRSVSDAALRPREEEANLIICERISIATPSSDYVLLTKVSPSTRCVFVRDTLSGAECGTCFQCKYFIVDKLKVT